MALANAHLPEASAPSAGVARQGKLSDPAWSDPSERNTRRSPQPRPETATHPTSPATLPDAGLGVEGPPGAEMEWGRTLKALGLGAGPWESPEGADRVTIREPFLRLATCRRPGGAIWTWMVTIPTGSASFPLATGGPGPGVLTPSALAASPGAPLRPAPRPPAPPEARREWPRRGSSRDRKGRARTRWGRPARRLR